MHLVDVECFLFSVEGLRKDAEYEFRVRAKNVAGLSSPTETTGPVHVKPKYSEWKFTWSALWLSPESSTWWWWWWWWWWEPCHHYHHHFFITIKIFIIIIIRFSFLRLVSRSCHHLYLIIIIYPLIARVVWAPQMSLHPVFSIFPCSPLPSGTCWTPGLSISWCCLPTSSSVSFVFFPLSLCLARWFWPDLMNRRHDLTLQFVSLSDGQEVFVWSSCLLDVGMDFLIGNMAFVWDVQDLVVAPHFHGLYSSLELHCEGTWFTSIQEDGCDISI